MRTVDLYPHNQRAYKAIQNKWETSNKAAVVQPTGTGKSYLILQCLYDKDNSNSVVLAPSNYILDQLLEHSEGLPNTRLLTYAKLSQMSPTEIDMLDPSLIVLDEFHRCGAEIWGAGVKALLDRFPTAYVLGTSATPIRHLDGNRNMSDELFESNVASSLTLTDAIAQGILPTPKIVIALYTLDEEVQSLQDKIDKSSNDDESKAMLHKEVEMLRRQLDKSKGIPEILKKHEVGAGKFIVFCKDKAHLHEIKPTVIEWFKKATGCKVESYSIFHDANDNDQQHRSFRDNRNDQNVRLMFSIEMYNEGIHIDDVTGVILLRPTTSPIIYFQQIGRTMQSSNTNTPLIFDFVNNRQSVRADDVEKNMKESIEREAERRRVLGDSGFTTPDFTIFDETLEALEMFAEIEDSLIDSFDANFEALKDYLEEFKEYPKKPSRLGSWIGNIRQAKKGNARFSLSEERMIKLELISFIWDEHSEKWDENFEKLRKSRESETQLEPMVKSWLENQRQQHAKGKLNKYRLERFASIGVTLDYFAELWDSRYQCLLDYKKENGHCDVPHHHISNRIPLGKWVASQRGNFKKGELNQERIEKLESIGFIWSVQLIKGKDGRFYSGRLSDDELNEQYKWLESSWELGINMLMKYQEIHNNVIVPLGFKIDSFHLGSWVRYQRKKYKNKEMSREHISELTRLGFSWNQNEDRWEDNYKLLKDGENPRKNWVDDQRKCFKKGELSQDRIDKLNAIGFVWELGRGKNPNSHKNIRNASKKGAKNQ